MPYALKFHGFKLELRGGKSAKINSLESDPDETEKAKKSKIRRSVCFIATKPKPIGLTMG